MRLATLLAPALALGLFAAIPAGAKEARKATPSFSVRDLDGKRVDLKSLKGKVVIINFWATWCRPCMQELPHLDAMQKKYGKKGLVVLAVSTDGPETASKVRAVTKRKRFKMRVLHDKDGALIAKLNPRANNPYTVFVDKTGKTAYRHEGYAPGDEKGYEAWVKKLLAE